MTFKYIRIQISIITLLIGINGCQSESSDSFPPLQFTVNTELLDSIRTLPQLNLAFRTPRGFIAVDDSQISQIQTNLQNSREADVPPFQLAAIYISSTEPQNIIFFSQVDSGSIKEHNFPAFINEYNRRYKIFAPDAETSLFTLNNIRCWQSRRIMGNRIHFRWLLEEPHTLPRQCDFNFITNSAQDPGRVIESFLGSILDKTKSQSKEAE